MIKNNKRGFNLIEIAIVLAVIGLVIGGIYVAASAVTENNRKQNSQKQLLQIVQNIRALYATQAAFVAPTNQLQAQQVFPADMNTTANDGTALNAYGGVTTLTAAGAGQQFSIVFNNVSQGACIDLLSKAFGAAQATAQIGLTGAGQGGTAIANAATQGITPVQAATVCTNAGNTNAPFFTFNLRG